MTSEERVASLHERMDTMRRVRERRITRVIGAAGILVTVCLILLIINGGMAHIGGTADMYSGAIMLFEGAGVYILLTVIAFMAGVIVAVILMNRKRRQNRLLQEENPAEDNKLRDTETAANPIFLLQEKEADLPDIKDHITHEGGCDEKES